MNTLCIHNINMINVNNVKSSFEISFNYNIFYSINISKKFLLFPTKLLIVLIFILSFVFCSLN